jgi:predicted phosphoadenosine phosphosulfate sulfurtransferase
MQRCSPAFGEEPLQKLWTYRTCFPELWDKMLERVPGVAAAARYATTELYGYGGRPAKPASMTWEAYVLSFLGRFEPPVASKVAARLRQEIASHHQQTADPIIPKAPHPISGVSWDYLLAIAMRGDFKHRKQAKAKVRGYDPATQAQMRAIYEAERREYEARA